MIKVLLLSIRPDPERGLETVFFRIPLKGTFLHLAYLYHRPFLRLKECL
jgi:hypothetical protein